MEVAANLCEAGVVVEELAAIASRLPEAVFPDAMAWLSCVIDSDRIVDEISASAGRISELVTAIKTYSHMDRSREHRPTDVRSGMDNTLTILGHKLKEKGIVVRRGVPREPTADSGERRGTQSGLDQSHRQRYRRHGRGGPVGLEGPRP